MIALEVTGRSGDLAEMYDCGRCKVDEGERRGVHAKAAVVARPSPLPKISIGFERWRRAPSCLQPATRMILAARVKLGIDTFFDLAHMTHALDLLLCTRQGEVR